MTLKHYLSEADGDELAAATVAAVSPTTGPTMTITTAFDAFPQDTVNYLNCIYTLTGVPGQPDVHATGRIRGRGHDTWGQPKKPFKVKLDDTKPLLGLPTSKDWALLANYNDPANISNALAFTLGQLCTGLPWTSHYGYVDLYFNGAYYGQFQLTETADISATRINVTKATGTTGLPLTGAYLLEINAIADSPKARYVTTQGVGINADDPDGTDATQWAYLTGFVQDFEDALYGVDFDDPDTGFRAFIDVPSFIDWYLVEEFASNVEGAFASSCKLVKTRDTDVVPGVLRMGPLWDFDRSFGSPQSGPATGYYVRERPGGAPGAKWLDRMLDDPTFKAETAARWATLKAAITAAGGMAKIIDTAVARVASGQRRDAARWDFNYSYADLLATTKTFVTARLAWMDSEFPA